MTEVVTPHSSPPIIFVQRGEAFYFPTVLVQAARRCTTSRIFVISDVSPASFLPPTLRSRVVWVPISTVESAADDFRHHYEHLSVNRPWLEQFCFERWFMIREVCRRENIDAVIHLDSDVLAQSDIGHHLVHRNEATVLFSRRSGPHVACFRDMFQLDRLCNIIVDTYRSPAGLSDLRRKYQAICDRGQMGSISDMHFFEQLVVSAGNAYGDTFQIVGGSFFDHCFGRSEGYRSRLGTKVVRHLGNEAFCYHVERGEWVRVLALHFQGVTKIWMAWHADVTSVQDAMRSVSLLCRGAVSYACRAHRYLLRKWIVAIRKWNARTAP